MQLGTTSVSARRWWRVGSKLWIWATSSSIRQLPVRVCIQFLMMQFIIARWQCWVWRFEGPPERIIILSLHVWVGWVHRGICIGHIIIVGVVVLLQCWGGKHWGTLAMCELKWVVKKWERWIVRERDIGKLDGVALSWGLLLCSSVFVVCLLPWGQIPGYGGSCRGGGWRKLLCGLS